MEVEYDEPCLGPKAELSVYSESCARLKKHRLKKKTDRERKFDPLYGGSMELDRTISLFYSLLPPLMEQPNLLNSLSYVSFWCI